LIAGAAFAPPDAVRTAQGINATPTAFAQGVTTPARRCRVSVQNTHNPTGNAVEFSVGNDPRVVPLSDFVTKEKRSCSSISYSHQKKNPKI